MIATWLSSTRSRSRPCAGFRAILLATVFVAAGCSTTTEPLDAEVVRLFDVTNNAIADLTPADGAEDVPRTELLDSVLRSQAAGTALRVVIAAPDGEFVPAKAVVDRYGGTAISYQANRTRFEGASADMSGAQLDRAIDAAKIEVDIGESAAAFVDLIENEGIDAPGRPLSTTLLWFLLIPAAVFMFSGAWSYLQARKRRIKRQKAFADRKTVLTDWAEQLGPEVDSLRTRALGADEVAHQSWTEANDFVAGIGPKLAQATSVGDLDAAEMRIGRVAIKLRDLRRSLDL